MIICTPNSNLTGDILQLNAAAPDYINIDNCRLIQYGFGCVFKIQLHILKEIQANNNGKIIGLPFSGKFEFNFNLTITKSQKFIGTCMMQIRQNDSGCYLYNNPQLLEGQMLNGIIVIPDVYITT